MKKNKFFALIGLFVLLCFFGCSGKKFLAEGEYYLQKTSIEYDNENRLTKANKGALKKKLPNVQRGNVLGMKWGVFVYERQKNKKKKKGFFYRFFKSFSSTPVLYQSRNADFGKSLLENGLKQMGFFSSQVTYIVKYRKYRAHIIYYVKLGLPTFLDSINYTTHVRAIDDMLPTKARKKNLKKGDRYSLKQLKEERDRIEEKMKNLGYYFFNDNDLLFLADSTQNRHKIDLSLRLKQTTPKQDTLVYKIGRISVFPDHRSSAPQETYAHTAERDGIRYSYNRSLIRLKALGKAIFFRSDSIFQRKVYQQTVRYLSGLGIYNFVNVQFHPNDSSKHIDTNIFLTPSRVSSFRTELGASTNSDGYTGPELTLGYNHQNIFRGAESLNVKLQGGVLKQLGSSSDFDLIYWVGINAGIRIPRIPRFMGWRPRNSPLIPYTTVNASFMRYDFRPLLRINYINSDYGFQWHVNERFRKRLSPIVLSYQQTPQDQESLDSLQGKYPILAQTFRNQFILGTSFNVTYNSTLSSTEGISLYNSFQADFSGNFLFLMNKLFQRKKSEGSFQILGVDFSQYIKFTNDFRLYYRQDSWTWANRLLVGVGIPWGNSKALPFTQQYFIGGPNDVRAFLTRSVGPGSYLPADSVQSFLGQGGDIKLEANTEFRFPIAGFLKGAVFLDAGNIWLKKEDPDRPGGRLNNNFYKELAIGTGLGIRADFRVLVIRADWSFPVRKPYLPESQRWVIKDISFLSKKWRKNNLVFSFSIGYPF